MQMCFVLTESTVDVYDSADTSRFCTSYCGWQSCLYQSTTSPNNNPSAEMANIMSHELTEAITEINVHQMEQ